MDYPVTQEDIAWFDDFVRRFAIASLERQVAEEFLGYPLPLDEELDDQLCDLTDEFQKASSPQAQLAIAEEMVRLEYLWSVKHAAKTDHLEQHPKLDEYLEMYLVEERFPDAVIAEYRKKHPRRPGITSEDYGIWHP